MIGKSLVAKDLKQKHLLELKEKIAYLKGGVPTLCVIQVGDNSASNKYISQKKMMADFVGIKCDHVIYPDDVTAELLISKIEELNAEENVHGIFVQMPLPKALSSRVKDIQEAILPEKDVDGLTSKNAGKLLHGEPDCLVPCTPAGIIEILCEYGIEILGKNVVVIGRSDLVGKPIAVILTQLGATVTLCHSQTQNVEFYTKNADIVVVAVGRANILKSEMVKEGATIIDVGINFVDGKMCGDADYEQIISKASATPVPGGVGQMTVAMLGANVYKAYCLQNKAYCLNKNKIVDSRE